MTALSKVISGIFVTYDDFKLYMHDHPDDFCYWIQSARYLNFTFLEPINIQETNLISAMFSEDISNGLDEWTQWTSWTDKTFIERVIKIKGKYPKLNSQKVSFEHQTLNSQ